MKALIVSLKAGNGHVKAAQALEIAFKKTFPQDELKNVDLLDYASVLSKNFYGNWYMDLVNAVPQFYEFMYEHLNPRTTPARIVLDRMNTQKFQKLVFDYDPDVIFATHFVPANILTAWREKYQKKYKIVTTLTDYEAHPLWVDNKFDLYTAATGQVKDELVNFGADSKKIIVTGIPVDEKFNQNFDRSTLREKLGLKNCFTIALFAGAFGTGPIVEIYSALLEISSDIQIVVVAGKNETLKNALEKIPKKDKKVTIFGFIDNMEEVMAASDIAISKAGGLTVSESLAAGLPLVINNPYPGQEEANTRYLQNNLAAFSAKDETEIVEIIKKITAEPELLKEVKLNLKKLARPEAAREIIEHGVSLLEETVQ